MKNWTPSWIITFCLGVALAFAQPAIALEEEDIAALKERALAGDDEAQFELGQAYQKGDGVEQSDSEAAHWVRKAAMQENTEAMVNLAIAYRGGFGVEHDNVAAYMWLDVAATRKNSRAIQLRKDVADRMTDEEIDKARQLANNWKPERE